MKYGILQYRKSVRKDSKKWCNLGDPIQSYALYNLYKRMGIDDEQIIHIDYYQLKSYDGEYVILPMSCYNAIHDQYQNQFNTLPVSDKIIPVFTSFHLFTEDFDESILDQLRSYQPIGCRDEQTMINLRKIGIRAFISGCMTATLPRRDKFIKGSKIYVVDAPRSILDYIPSVLKNRIEITTHLPVMERLTDSFFLSDDEISVYNAKAYQQLLMYKEDASLVITSRLHAAVPCIAMGIPVILAGDNFDTRFSWIDKFVPLYTPTNFKDIDWNPSPIEYENEKEQMISVFSNQIKKAYNDNAQFLDISTYWENRNRAEYNKGLSDAISNLPFHNSQISYALWGIRSDTINFYHFIKQKFPNWSMQFFIDQNIYGSYYEDKKIIHSDELEDTDNNLIVFVIPEAAHIFAAKLLAEKGIPYILVNNKTEFEIYR
ncbi:MAG: polysaccharide pyruvyl transferase family protein [Clostridiales bacterium]|jgi:hypothetical protein|nr:polysaccharide pyruvyl transferase family protein [Clostridiales bacterium]